MTNEQTFSEWFMEALLECDTFLQDFPTHKFSVFYSSYYFNHVYAMHLINSSNSTGGCDTAKSVTFYEDAIFIVRKIWWINRWVEVESKSVHCSIVVDPVESIAHCLGTQGGNEDQLRVELLLLLLEDPNFITTDL